MKGVKEVRAFIAVEFVPALRRQLHLLQQNLKESRADVKWVEAENLHLTLHFLGEVEEGLILRVRNCMEKTGEEFSPFTISLAGTGTFPGPERPRVLWVGLANGSKLLAQLRQRLGDYLEEIGVSLDRRPFSPHITLGRVRSPLNADRLTAKMRAYAKDTWGSQEVTRLSLFESRLSREGPQYQRLTWVKLGSKSAGTLTDSGKENIMD
ncbi:hypothetical protein SY88_00685 [Clostridiales bacterium PH28_bin88]|nr:hypothetical protein SY88_00685 [Clostridiales bacterium PH28_bin88]